MTRPSTAALRSSVPLSAAGLCIQACGPGRAFLRCLSGRLCVLGRRQSSAAVFHWEKSQWREAMSVYSSWGRGPVATHPAEPTSRRRARGSSALGHSQAPPRVPSTSGDHWLRGSSLSVAGYVDARWPGRHARELEGFLFTVSHCGKGPHGDISRLGAGTLSAFRHTAVPRGGGDGGDVVLRPPATGRPRTMPARPVVEEGEDGGRRRLSLLTSAA